MVALTHSCRLHGAALFRRPDPAAPPAAGHDPAAPAARHDPDFAVVVWGPARFAFSPKQRRVVRALWEAAASGQVYVSQARLLRAADSDGDRVHDLFRKHPAWGTLIAQGPPTGGPRGSYRLSPDLTPGGEFTPPTGEPVAAPAFGGPIRG